MQYMVNVQDQTRGTAIITGNKTDEAGVEAIFLNFADGGTWDCQQFIKELNKNGANTHNPGPGAMKRYRIIVMQVES